MGWETFRLSPSSSSGHFALETHAQEIGAKIHEFLDRKLG